MSAVRWLVVLGGCLLVSACRGCETAPPGDDAPTAKGRARGRIVVSGAGTAVNTPAQGALVRLERSTVTTRSDANGEFQLPVLVGHTGLLITYVRPLDMAQLSARVEAGAQAALPGAEAQLGDIVLQPNGAARGNVVLPDNTESPEGTLVVVPETPLTTLTSTGGAFLMDQLPPGAVQFLAVRTGFNAHQFSGGIVPASISLLLDQHLIRRTTPPGTGTVRGTVVLLEAPDNGGADIQVTPYAMLAATGSSSTDGAFEIRNIPEGLSSIRVHKDGFTDLVLLNMYIPPGGTLDLGALVLGTGEPLPNMQGNTSSSSSSGGSSTSSPLSSSAGGSSLVASGVSSSSGGSTSSRSGGSSSSGTSSSGGVTATGLTLEFGDAQQGVPGQTLGLMVLRLTDANGQPRAGVTVTCTPSAGAQVDNPTQVTSVLGRAGFRGTLGNTQGVYTFTFSAPGAPSDVTATATANPVAAETVLSIINPNHTAPTMVMTGPVATAAVPGLRLVTTAADDTVYFASSSNQILRMTTGGVVEAVAGQGALPLAGGRLGSEVALDLLSGLQVDQAHDVLFFMTVTGGASRVWALQLSTHLITGYAGGGASTAENVLATDAALGSQATMALAGDGSGDLYIADVSRSAIAKVTRATGLLTHAFDWGSCATATFGFDRVFSILADPTGGFLLAAIACGTQALSGSVNGIAHYDDLGGGVADVGWVAGSSPGSTVDGVSVRQASLYQMQAMAVDEGGNVYFSVPAQNVIRRADAVTGVVQTVMGTFGTSGASGDYGPAGQALLSRPTEMAFDRAGNLYVADSSNHALRVVYALGRPAPANVNLTLTPATNNQTAPINQIVPNAMEVTVTANGQPVRAVEVIYDTPFPSVWLSSAALLTDGSGRASFRAAVPPRPGTYSARARYLDLHRRDVPGSPAVFTFQATAPASGDIFSLLAIRGRTEPRKTGPAAVVTLSPGRVVARANGNLIFRATDGVFQMDTDGVVSWVAGEIGGDSADYIPASMANAGADGPMAWDEARGLLYLMLGNRLRVVDMADGLIHTVAGGGPAGQPNDGDGGGALGAHLPGPNELALLPDGDVLVLSGARIRRVRVQAQTIEPYFTPPPCTDAVSFNNSGGATLASDAQGNVYFGGLLCGTSFSGGIGVLRISPSLQLTRVAGRGNGSTMDGALAVDASFASVSPISTNPAGTLLYVNDGASSGSRIREVTVGGTVRTLAGNGTAVASGDYGPAVSAGLQGANAMTMTPAGDLVISVASPTLGAMRMVWR